MTRSRFILVGALILIALASRLLPHLPNFTAMSAIALFCGFNFSHPLYALGIVLSTALVSDSLLGFYPDMPFVYFSYALIACLGCFVKSEKPISKALTSLTCSFLFFFITNYGVWYSTSLYEKSFLGLSACYVAGLPFLLNQILGDLTYLGLISFMALKIEQSLSKPSNFAESI